MQLPFLSGENLDQWVSAIGYIGIGLLVFAETGLFFCFFFPGDSLLFTAGLLAARNIFSIQILVLVIISAATAGYAFGYWFGKRLGHWLMQRPDKWYFKKKYVQHAHDFYDKYGKKALLIGRFIPLVRTFLPVVGGMVKMPVKTYMLFNVMGAVLWGSLVPLLGYYLGAVLPDANEYLMLVIAGIILLSVMPIVFELAKKLFGKRNAS